MKFFLQNNHLPLPQEGLRLSPVLSILSLKSLIKFPINTLLLLLVILIFQLTSQLSIYREINTENDLSDFLLNTVILQGITNGFMLMIPFYTLCYLVVYEQLDNQGISKFAMFNVAVISALKNIPKYFTSMLLAAFSFIILRCIQLNLVLELVPFVNDLYISYFINAFLSVIIFVFILPNVFVKVDIVSCIAFGNEFKSFVPAEFLKYQEKKLKAYTFNVVNTYGMQNSVAILISLLIIVLITTTLNFVLLQLTKNTLLLTFFYFLNFIWLLLIPFYYSLVKHLLREI